MSYFCCSKGGRVAAQSMSPKGRSDRLASMGEAMIKSAHEHLAEIRQLRCYTPTMQFTDLMSVTFTFAGAFAASILKSYLTGSC